MEQIENIERNENNKASKEYAGAEQIINKIMIFLQLFMCETLVKRIMSTLLIALGVPNARITELTGLCDRSIRTLKKEIENGDTEGLFIVGGGGRKRKLQDVEDAIVEEIEKNNYHSRQQIADMILEKYGIKVSLPAIGRLLKKTGSSI
jgi:transposase